MADAAAAGVPPLPEAAAIVGRKRTFDVFAASHAAYVPENPAA
jgi:hypothetical protein